LNDAAEHGVSTTRFDLLADANGETVADGVDSNRLFDDPRFLVTALITAAKITLFIFV